MASGDPEASTTTHRPALHATLHASPQPPQLLLSVCVSTHPPLHIVVPASQLAASASAAASPPELLPLLDPELLPLDDDDVASLPKPPSPGGTPPRLT